MVQMLLDPPKTRDVVILVHKLDTRSNILNDLSMQIRLLKPAGIRTSCRCSAFVCPNLGQCCMGENRRGESTLTCDPPRVEGYLGSFYLCLGRRTVGVEDRWR